MIKRTRTVKEISLGILPVRYGYVGYNIELYYQDEDHSYRVEIPIDESSDWEGVKESLSELLDAASAL